MKNKYISISNFKLPKKNEILLTFKAFSKKEWAIFGSLVFVFILSTLIVLHYVNQSFMIKVPMKGGNITEGIIGTPRFVNPLLAFSDVDKDLVNLIYSGLMRKDKDGNLILDLAESYEVAPNHLSYTFTLKDKIYFQDGEPVTIDDIIFTIQEAKNPVLRVSNAGNWERVSVEKIDEKTVRFNLRTQDAGFLENTTLGIMPAHLWKGFPMELNDRNTSPVGSGPFMIKNSTKEAQGIVKSYGLVPFKKFTLGKPYVKSINLKFYNNESDLISALEKGEVDQISQISPENAEKLKEKGYKIESYVLPRIFGMFFNHNENQLFIDKSIVSAINTYLDKKRILEEVLYGYGQIIDSPMPNKNAQEDEKLLTREEKKDLAENILTKAGWKKNEDGFFAKKEAILSFSISTSNSEDLKKTAELIQKNLMEIGMKVEVKTFELGDLNQSVIKPRKYDALLFGEIINRQSDLFAFWHSSQRKEPGLNVAMYTNVKVDKILEEALSIHDKEKREAKYLEFENEIKKENPAVFIYSPEFIYVVKDKLEGISNMDIPSSKDRFNEVYNWYTETDSVWKIFTPNN
ncbi:MAG: peptide ABC transporter substrate-binding protein [Candidatus Pacebacteria bacterium]|nr:peptide ABC transporter substrate-binding protein [Candidatus Paceibacterota bacterium]MCF7862748.1 peptide ABC transporter substrate-binding protein [Candidatus Paceibacterota bacterium]